MSHHTALSAKFAELTAQITSLRRENRDLTLENDSFASREAEILEQLEMATLDKEVAEERCETAEAELTGLKESVEVMKVEIEVLKEENGM
jgi:dynactin 1